MQRASLQADGHALYVCRLEPTCKGHRYAPCYQAGQPVGALLICRASYEACRRAAGGQQPFHVLVTGHSLGAGLAAIAAPYFALQWPGADVTSITFGASQHAAVDDCCGSPILVSHWLAYLRDS